ncbi:MAG TPA: DUF4255 domain-containing protein [Geobacteraceae bacterium]|nr:DUF4255 domain-containing protein [Geobacteraceae bacterium]
MFDDLDRTLTQLLKQGLPSGVVQQVSISFAPPDDSFPPSSVSLPAIDLFLYDIRENRELRSKEWELERRSDGTALRRRPPVRVDCSYLITAWPSKASSTPAYHEHMLLGEVLKVLLRYPTIPDQVQQGSLKGQDPGMPAATIQPGQLQSMGEFWQALGGKAKAALNYTVTIALEPFDPEDTGPLVTDKLLKFRQGVDGS